MSKPRLSVSFSGGRTSAFMSIWLKQNASDAWDLRFVFANTGWEHPDTLRFVNEVDRRYDLGLTWVEAVVHPGRKSCTHKVVDYATASRNGEPFEAVCAKYGLPNGTFLLCTRELKLNPMNSWRRSVGWGDSHTAIGIRADEQRRVRRGTAEAQKIVYPLVDWFPTDKQDVLAFFEGFDWDLRIPEYDGNCVRCYKKSDAKLLRGYRDDPASFDFPIKLERLYENVGPNNVPGPRRMYRGYRSATQLVEAFRGVDFTPLVGDGGCSESCEVYETEVVA